MTSLFHFEGTQTALIMTLWGTPCMNETKIGLFLHE